jgi:hypothetical protein
MFYKEAPRLIRDYLSQGSRFESSDPLTAFNISRIVGCSERVIRAWRVARRIPAPDTFHKRRAAWSRQALRVWSGCDKPAYVPTGSEVPEGRIVRVVLHVLVSNETYADAEAYCTQRGVTDISAPIEDTLQSGVLTLDPGEPVTVDGVSYPRVIANVGE